MSELIFSNDQFYIVILTVIWIYISSLGYERDDIPLLWVQLLIAIPLAIMLLASAFLKGESLGYGVGFAVLVASAYMSVLATNRDKKNKGG